MRVEFSARTKNRDDGGDGNQRGGGRQQQSQQGGGGGGSGGGGGPKPAGCTAIFMGGCPYDIDDADVYELFKSDGEIKVPPTNSEHSRH